MNEQENKTTPSKDLWNALRSIVQPLINRFVATSPYTKIGSTAAGAYLVTILGAIGLDYPEMVVLEDSVEEIAIEATTMPQLPDGHCYYVSDETQISVEFSEYATGLVSGEVRSFIPMVDNHEVLHDLGSVPSLQTAECPSLKDDKKLSAVEAGKLSVEWKQAFIHGGEMQEALSRALSGEGFVTITHTPKPS